MTEHLHFTRSVQNTAVSNVTGGFVENRETMKSTAVKHVHDMCMKCYPTLKAQCHLSPRYNCKGVKLTVHIHLVTKLWVCGAGTPQTIIRTSYLSTGLNPLEIFGFAIFFNFPINLSLINIFYPKFPIRTVNYLIIVESVHKMAWRISDYFEPTENDFNLTCLGVYQESNYSRVCIGQNKINCFQLDSRYTISDWWWIV